MAKKKELKETIRIQRAQIRELRTGIKFQRSHILALCQASIETENEIKDLKNQVLSTAQ